jgi:ribosomal protein L27
MSDFKPELSTPKVMDFLEIKDAETGEILVRQRGENQTVPKDEEE